MATAPASLKRRVASILLPYRELLDRANWNARWIQTIKENHFPLFGTRNEMYRYLNSVVICGAPMEYLEFGVAGGDSMRAWCRINSCEDSRFHGFDCFTGLPENWTAECPKGAFDRRGMPPKISDAPCSISRRTVSRHSPRLLEYVSSDESRPHS